MKGGGAELLVRELHKRFLGKGLTSYALYLSGDQEDLGSKEFVMSQRPKSIFNIFRVRQFIKSVQKTYTGKITVHAHLTWPFLFTALAVVGLNNIRLVYTEHNTFNRRRKIIGFKYIERLLYSRYERVICISSGVQESLKPWVGSRLSNKIDIIPNGSRLYSLANRRILDGRKARLVSVGSLSPQKNFATVLGALTELKGEIESYSIIGEGPERHRLEILISQLGLDDIVYLVGWSESVERYLHASDIQLIPSIWEGFGLVAVEGMSTGIPIIASDVPGLREVLSKDNHGITLVANPTSSEDWIYAVRDTINSIKYESSNSIGIELRGYAMQFSLDEMAERYLNVYDSL